MDNQAKMSTPPPMPSRDGQPRAPLMHEFKPAPKGKSGMFHTKFLILLLVVALLGIGSGYVLAQSGGKTGIASLDKVAHSSNVEKGKTYGSGDAETFKDTAEGIVKEGGVEDEGQYHLVRPGGESQNVYLTSSSVDLSQFIDRKVKVWGQTQKAQKVAWLMDVGKVEVLD